MPAPAIELANEVAAQLSAATGYAFERRNAAYLDRADVENGKWVVAAAGEDTQAKGRGVDRSTLAVDVAFQIALPESADAFPDPIENHPWFETQMANVENVKSLFRPDGLLRDESFLGLYFSRMSNKPIYRPEMLTDYQIFTAVVRLEFVGEV